MESIDVLENIAVEDLDKMKYTELQKLAKSHGIKANQKMDKLIVALKEKLQRTVHNEIDTAEQCETDLPKDTTALETLDNNDTQESCARSTVSVEAHEDVSSVEKEASSQDSGSVTKQINNNSFTITHSSVVNSDDHQQHDVIVQLDTSIHDSHMEDEGNEDDEVIFKPMNPRSEQSITSENQREVRNDVKDDDKVSSDATVKQTAPKTNIPVFCGNAAKPATYSSAYWAKIHEKGFQNMDSIDVYWKKREQRKLYLTTPGSPRNLEPKRDNCVSSVKRKSIVNSVNRKSLAPLNSPAPDTQSKDKFDLKASLARPLTWKPYTGAVKPFTVEDIRPDIKKVKIKGREDRRMEAEKRRDNKRATTLNNRRNLNV